MLKELIEYNGVDSFQYKDFKNFKQFNVNNIVSIPIEKPDIGHILKVWSKYNIDESSIVTTPKAISYDGNILTGYKSFICGDLNFKLEYVAGNGNNTIHSVNFDIPFSSYVTLSSDYNEYSSIFPSLYIEDIYCKSINTREIYINITLIAVVNTSN